MRKVMDLAKLKKLLAIVAESDVAEVEIEEEGLKVVVRKSAPPSDPPAFPPYPPYHVGYFSPPPAVPAATAVGSEAAAEIHASNEGNVIGTTAPESQAPSNNTPVKAESEGEAIRAPIVGTFYRSPSPDSDAFVNVGDRVQPGDILCIIEAMKLMNEIECETSGVVRRILVENAEPVEFDQPLFIIDPD